MAEVQTNTQTGELTQRFIEFVMMQAQNAALFLGQIPNPQTGAGEVNLDVAKMFIDQLAMIQEKTRGNLSNEEATVLRNTISNLQMAFVEVSQNGAGGKNQPESIAAAPAAPEPASSADPAPAPTATDAPPASSSTAPAESESRKKFTKSYGA
ncbi:MAG TPA: DUF1844 domain-containing protein [Chthoniobacterales bacterium]|nr:DUF1844 domain-containing protein [Chthoniobacterales bacterium]